MKKYLSLIASLWCANFAFAEIYTYEFYPQIGTEWSVHQKSVKTTNRADKAPETNAEVSGVLEVTGHTETGYIYTWTTQKVSVEGATFTANNSPPEMFIGRAIEFEASADGIPIRLSNVTALIDEMTASIQKISADKYDDKTVEATKALLNSTAPHILAAQMLKEAALVGSCQFYQLDSETPTVQEQAAEVLTGAPPILIKATTTLVDPGSEVSPAIISYEEAYNPESAAASMLVFLTNMAQQVGADVEDEIDAVAFERTSKITCKVDVQTGETREVLSEVHAQSDGIFTSEKKSLVVKRRALDDQ